RLPVGARPGAAPERAERGGEGRGRTARRPARRDGGAMSLSAGPGGRAGGFVLVAVLLLLTAVGLIAVAMSLEAGLATLGARAAAGASAARPAARAALVLALDEVVTAAAAGLEPPETFGPWTLGAAGAGARSALVGGAEETVYEL